MNERNLIIVCVTAILCVAIVAGTLVVTTLNTNIPVISDNSNNNQTSSASEEPLDIKSVTFYSDGNPNTGEVATINFGSQHAGKTVEVSTVYYRDGVAFNNQEFATVTIADDGTVKITDTTSMRKYPDKCVINVRYESLTFTKTASLGKYTGSQTVNF